MTGLNKETKAGKVLVIFMFRGQNNTLVVSTSVYQSWSTIKELELKQR